MKILPATIALATVLAVTLSACATISPQQRVRTSLVEAGLSPRLSACMADRMVDRLSLGQLQRLKSLASLGRADLGAMTVDRFLHKLRALDDPQIFLVTSRAALGCAL